MRFFSHKLPFFAFAMAYQSYFIASDFQVSLEDEEILTEEREKNVEIFFRRNMTRRKKNEHSFCVQNCLGVRCALSFYDSTDDANKLL